MIENLCIIVNTTSKCSDLWPMFFSQLDKHFPDQQVYVFTDKDDEILKKHTKIIYDANDSYRTQYLKSIKQVSEEYCIIMNEDYVLYDDVDMNKLMYCFDYLKNNSEMSFIRLTKGIEYNEAEIKKNIYLMDNKNMCFFSQVVGIWRTKHLEKIYEDSPESGIGTNISGTPLEVLANEVCKNLNLKGVFFYCGEPKRGRNHYDSTVFPYIATAINKGKWNIHEYPREIIPLITKYNINVHKRGIN